MADHIGCKEQFDATEQAADEAVTAATDAAKRSPGNKAAEDARALAKRSHDELKGMAIPAEDAPAQDVQAFLEDMAFRQTRAKGLVEVLVGPAEPRKTKTLQEQLSDQQKQLADQGKTLKAIAKKLGI